MRELASREGVDSSYISRMVDLTVPDYVALFDLAVDPPTVWAEQWGREAL